MFDELITSSDIAAPRLLGALLIREQGDQRMLARIVEVEAYSSSDAASHTFRGKTPRNSVMFGPPGYLYVYFTYGMHYCMNVVCGADGDGAAVLIRAVEPLEGEDHMTVNRHGRSGIQVSNGPAKVCQALSIDRTMNGHFLGSESLQLILQPPLKLDQIVQTTRIGITRAVDVPWRFYIRNNPYVSRPAAAIELE